MNWAEAVGVNDAARRAALNRGLLLAAATALLVNTKDIVVGDPELSLEIITVAQKIMRVAAEIPVAVEKGKDEE